MLPERRHRLAPHALIPRHRHAEPYAALVLRGGYEEAGECGRFRVGTGDVLIHAAFSSHLDRTHRCAEVLNLPLPLLWAARSDRWCVHDPDAIARTAERDLQAATEMLLASLVPGAPALDDAPDELARTLASRDATAIASWSRGSGVTRQTTWRWFHDLYGVAPTRFRVEARARRAWRRVMQSTAPLSVIASDEGYADQAHMTRDLRAFTGHTPGHWRDIRSRPAASPRAASHG